VDPPADEPPPDFNFIPSYGELCTVTSSSAYNTAVDRVVNQTRGDTFFVATKLEVCGPNMTSSCGKCSVDAASAD